MTKAILQRIQREPAVLVGLVTAAIALGTAFGLDLTAEQNSAIIGFVTVGLAFVTRALVTPTVSVAAAEKDDKPGGEIVAGDASDLPNETPVDVIESETYDPRHD